jgi:hypothetical protein
MRYVVLGFYVVAVACAGTAPSAPTGPSSTITAPSSTGSVVSVMEAHGSELPFRGTLQATETVAGALHRLNGTGEATHLGRFTLISEFTVIPPPVSTASGTATWTAANGDQIFTTIAGQAVITFPVAAIAETHTITGGNGRFAEAFGSFVVERSLNLQTLVSSASITGTISLGH